MLPPSKVKVPKEHREEPEQMEFADARQREKFFAEKEKEKAARDAAVKEAAAKKAARQTEKEDWGSGETKAPGASARLKIYDHDTDYRCHLALVFTFTWTDADGQARQSQVVLRLPGGSATVAASQPLSQVMKDYQDEVADGRVFDGADGWFLEVRYEPVAGVWATNAITTGEFGPWQSQVDRLRSFVVDGACIGLCLSHASSLEGLIAAVQGPMKEDHEIDPMLRFWSGAHQDLFFTTKNINPPTAETSIVGSSRVSFRNLLEYCTYEMVGLARNHEWELNDLSPLKLGQSARFMRVDGKGNENMLIVLVDEDPAAPLGLQDGDSVEVRIHSLNADNIAEDNWVGRVEPALPHFNATDRTLVIHRRFDRESQEWRGANASVLGDLPSLAQITSPERARSLIEAQQPRAIDVSIQADTKAYRRGHNTLRAVRELIEQERAADPRHCSVTEELILANRFDRLPQLDLLHDMGPQVVQRLLGDLSESQLRAHEAFRAMKGGFALVQGCAGAGKTHVVIVTLAYMALNLSVQQTRGYRRGLRALIVSPINTNAERLTEDIRDKMAAIGVKDAVVVRKFARNTTKELSLRHANAGRDDQALHREPTFDADAAWAELKESAAVAKQVYHELHTRRQAPFPQDERVTDQGLVHSPTEYLLYALELVPVPEGRLSQAAVDRVRDAIPEDIRLAVSDAYNNYLTVREMDDDTKSSLSTSIRDALDHVYNAADVIVCTVQQAMDPQLWLGFRPEVFVCDEAGKALSAEGVAWAWYPGCHHRILVGDSMQSRPVVRSPVTANTFGPQLELSLFVRLRLAGFPVVLQYEQHRYNAGITRFLSDLFYDGQVTVAPSSLPQLEDGATRFKAFARQLNPACDTSVLLMNVRDSQEEMLAVGGSKFNRGTAATVWAVVDALEADGYAPGDIAIISLYVATRTLHEGIANRRALEKGLEASAPRYLIETAERAQSLQRRILVVDFPTTANMGFINSATRLCTGLSRVQDGLILCMDVANLEQIPGYRGRMVARIVEWCKRNQVMFGIQPVPADNLVWCYMPTVAKRDERVVPTDFATVPEISFGGHGEDEIEDENQVEDENEVEHEIEGDGGVEIEQAIPPGW